MISCKTLATSIPQILPNKQIKEQIHKWQQLNKINLEIGNVSRQNFGNVITSKGMCHVINHLQHRTSKFHSLAVKESIQLPIQTTM